jgi:hypothetical protein
MRNSHVDADTGRASRSETPSPSQSVEVPDGEHEGERIGISSRLELGLADVALIAIIVVKCCRRSEDGDKEVARSMSGFNEVPKNQRWEWIARNWGSGCSKCRLGPHQRL